MKTTSLSMLAVASVCAFVLGCGGGKKSSHTETKTGPVVANVGEDTITADEFKKKLDETSPFLRARYNTVERKKEFLENLIRNELLVQEAEKRGLENSPAVREQVKRALVTELLRQQLDERLSGSDIAEADLKKFYDTHQDDFLKPERARVFRLLIAGAKDDAKAHAAAKKKAAEVSAAIAADAKKGNANAFQDAAKKESQDKLSAPMAGDLRFLSKDEMTKTYSAELAAASFDLKAPGDVAGPIETPQGFELVKLQVKTAALDRKFDEAKEQIRGRMARERRSKEYDDFIKGLREKANVKIDEAALDKVSASEVPAGAPGMPGAPGAPGMPGMQMPRPAPIAPAPAPQK